MIPIYYVVSKMEHTCGGGGSVGGLILSTSNGHTYLSGFSLLTKLQSYSLLSSSDDSISYDSFQRMQISKRYHKEIKSNLWNLS